jgi:hypothetical protein
LFLKKLNPIRRIRELTEELSRTRRERDQPRKGSERLKRQASAILGAEYAGWLIHDGWKILLQVLEGFASELRGAFDPALSRLGGSGISRRRGVSVGDEANPGGGTGLAGPLSGEPDLAACLWTATGRLEAKLDLLRSPKGNCWIWRRPQGNPAPRLAGQRNSRGTHCGDRKAASRFGADPGLAGRTACGGHGPHFQFCGEEAP